MKRCAKCGIEKPTSDFYKSSSKPDGLQYQCKACDTLAAAARRRANPQKHRDAVRRHYRANTETRKEWVRLWRQENAEQARQTYSDYCRNNPDKIRAKASRQRAALAKAIPVWFEKDAVDTVYAKATEMGLEVDHVVPLTSPIVCGLHCWANLQLLTREVNASKGNRHWPDMPEEIPLP